MNREKACLFIAAEKQGTKNYPFTAGPEGDGFKNLLYAYIELKARLADFGIELATRDIHPPEESFITFVLDNPHLITAEKKEGQVWVLIINDPPIYCPESWDKAYHDRFDYVLTFDETLVDDVKYFYYPFAIDTEYFDIPDSVVDEQTYGARTLGTFVSHAIHKFPDPKNPGSTLHRRYATVKWFADNHPDDFGFYGGTFLKRDYYFAFRGVGLVKKLLPHTLFSAVAKGFQRNLFKVFKGELAPLEKFEVIGRYNFYYCYENTIGINGYVCEKIFDCFYHNIVPVYWGAPNIKELIPYDCFVDGRGFTDEESLYRYLKGMSYERYSEYLRQAHVFLRSPEMERFTVRSSIGRVLAPVKDRLSQGWHHTA